MKKCNQCEGYIDDSFETCYSCTNGINIKKNKSRNIPLPKILILFVAIFIINFIEYKNKYNIYVFNPDSRSYDIDLYIISSIIGYTSTPFIIIGFIAFIISIINWIINKKFKWIYSDWLLLIVVFIEILLLNSNNKI